jgi:prevent-host-death family protein
LGENQVLAPLKGRTYVGFVSTTLTIAEAQTRLAQLLELAQAGHEVIIEDATKGKARLVPVAKSQPPGPRVFGLHEGETWMSDDFNAPLPDSFCR